MSEQPTFLVVGSDHWERRAADNRIAYSVSEARIREIVREEIEWALKMGSAKAPAQRPVIYVSPAQERKAERFNEIAATYATGLTLAETAIRHNCAPSTVRKALDVCGVSVRPQGSRKPDDDRTARIIELRAQGWRLEEIGAQFKITRERVRQILQRNGLTGERALNAKELAAVERYVAGDSLILVAESLGIHPNTMRNYIARAGHTIRPNPSKRHEITLERSEIAARLYTEGKKLREIAEELGLSKPEMVYRLLAIAGIKPSRLRKQVGV